MVVDAGASAAHEPRSVAARVASPASAAFTDACFGIALVLAWALMHGFSGIEGDARIYMGRALADLDPNGVGRDMMFAMDGQSSFTVFRVVARVLVAKIGFGATLALVSITNMVVWFAAMVVLVRSIVPGRAIALALATVCVLPRLYTPWNLLAAGEAIAVPRPLAEAGVLLALAALYHRRYAWCLVALTGAALFHPIMAAPGFGILVIVLGLRDWRWFGVTALLAAIGVTAGMLGLPVVSRFTVTVDPVWRDLLLERSPYLFLGLWQWNTFGLVVVQVATLVIGVTWLPPRARTIFYASLAVAALGCAASYLMGDLMNDLLVLQAQLWRALWLPAVLAPVAAGACFWHLPSRGARGQITLALLCLAWGAADVFPLAPVAACAAVGAYFGIPRLSFQLGRPVVIAAWIACVVLVGVSTWSALVTLRQIWPPSPLGFNVVWLLLCLLKLPTIPLLLAAFAAWRWPQAPATRLAAALVVAAGLVLLATAWDVRTPAHADADAATIKPDLVTLLASRPGAVLWVDSDDVWYWARRPNWIGPTQGGGIIFSRDLAMLWQQRAQTMFDAGLATRNILDPWGEPISLGAVHLDPVKIERFCQRRDAPAWIVASLDQGVQPPASLAATIWSPPIVPMKLFIVAPRTRWRALERYAVIPCGTPSVASR